MDEALSEIDELRKAQPSWRADSLGVRGNPIEFHKEQARVDWPAATLNHRIGKVDASVSTPGAPEPPATVPAT